MTIPRRLALPVVAVAAMVSVAAGAPGTAGAATRPPVDIQVLNVSDFHGQLDPLSVFGIGDVGGAAALSSYWAADRAANPRTLLLTAGDAVGASPPLSSFFDDRPTIQWMNYAGFDADALGNHNFDAGLGRLQSQIDAAAFPYLAANLSHLQGNLTGVAPYKVVTVAGVKIAVIGVTNPEAPSLVAPGSLGSIVITDPVAAAQRARARAVRAGARVVIAIGHLGVEGSDPVTGAATGPLIDFANAVDGFDLILGDHTNVKFSGTINGALVLENLSKGATYARTTLRVDPRSGRLISASSQFVVPLAGAVTPDPTVQALLAPYRAQLSSKLDVAMGVATDTFPRGANIERLDEVAIGDLVADSLRTTYGTQIAFTNGGGLRSPLPSSYQPADTSLRRATAGYAPGPPYDLVLGDAYSVLPFGNQAVTRTVTGAQLWSVLERSVGVYPAAFGGFLQVSGFRFTYSASAPVGSRVQSVTLDDGTAIPNSAATTVTATTNDFTNAGGDGYPMLADGQGVSRDLMATVLADYIVAAGTISPTVGSRIIRLP